MKSSTLTNELFHLEHGQWKRELLFWEDELSFFNNRLGEIVGKWTDKEVLAKLEQFQNQFIRQAEVIDTLQHDIRIHEDEMATHLKKAEDALGVEHSKLHKAFQERMKTQRKIYKDLKKEFFKYLSKYM
ncbi:MAG: hypothetical protein R2728_03195 [Chitinophagales bacterium]